MNLFLVTQHSIDGASPGVQTFQVFNNIPGPPGVAVPSFLVQRGNYIQVIDQIVNMGDGLLRFGAGATTRDLLVAKMDDLLGPFD